MNLETKIMITFLQSAEIYESSFTCRKLHTILQCPVLVIRNTFLKNFLHSMKKKGKII